MTTPAPAAPTSTHHLGVYGVVFDEGGRLLVIRKARGPYVGLLDLPGGSMEPGELLEETLDREVAEETGCELLEAMQIGAFSTRFEYDKDGAPHCLRHVAILYEAALEGTPRAAGDGEDSDGCLWIDLTAANLAKASPLVQLVASWAQQKDEEEA